MSGQKKILVSLPETLLSQIDDFLADKKFSRSEFIREAMRFYLKQKKINEMHEQMKKGYAQMGEINLKIAEMCFEADCIQCRSYEEKIAECE